MIPSAWEERLEHHPALTVVAHARLASKLLRPQMLHSLGNQNVPEAIRSLTEAQESCRHLLHSHIGPNMITLFPDSRGWEAKQAPVHV